MRLQIGPNIGNNKVRLDFKQSPSRPEVTPSYVADISIANEFVNKYNDQSKSLIKTTALLTSLGAAVGFVIGIKRKSAKLLKTLLGIIGGSVAGFGLGVGYSTYKKDKIMKKYDVKEI